MSDQLSKVVEFWRCESCGAYYTEKITECDCAPGAYDLRRVLMAPVIESAAAPVEEVEGHAVGMEARDMHAEARLIRTLARQLAEVRERMQELEAQRDDYLNREWIAEKAKREAERQLAAATRRVAEVEGALDHIARVGMGSRNKTKRTQWIITRAISALNGDENWRGQETPHGYHDALEAKEHAT